MKILIISPTSSGIGGIAGVVQNQIKFLKNKGHEVDVISSNNTFTIPVKGLKNLSFMISSFLKTRRKKHYDIVHAHNPASGLAMKNISGKKVISLWGIFENQIEILHGSTLSKISGKYEKEILKYADAITVASKTIQQYYSQLNYPIYYIPNGIDLDSVQESKERLYPKQIIFVGRLSKEKGIFDLLKIAQKIPPELNLLIIDSGPEEEKVKNISNNFSNIHYLGYQSHEKVISLIKGSDILIQPSLVEGGLNSTLLEAMICKIPLLTTSLDIYADEIKHLETAFCIPINSPDKLLKGIIELMNNTELQKNLVIQAFKIAEKHSWDQIGNQYIQLYHNLLKS